jgi:prevent-host-death family protein
MKIASVADVKAHFSAYVKESEKGPVVVTRNGKPVAVLLAVSDEDELERLMMAYSPRLQALLGAARQRIQAGEGIPGEAFWREVEGGQEGRD